MPEATIYVYDNNSDGTDEIARQAGAVVRYEYRQGKGNVIRSMFRDIEADCYLMIDGDDIYPAEHAKEMCDLVLSGKADMVIGDRLSSTYFEENKRPFHNFGNVLVRKYINVLWGEKKREPIVDVMTGYVSLFSMFAAFLSFFLWIDFGYECEEQSQEHLQEGLADALVAHDQLEHVIVGDSQVFQALRVPMRITPFYEIFLLSLQQI